MFVIRQSKPEDAATLQKLARMVYFINLPPDERLILEKIQHSQRCFDRLAAGGAPAAKVEVADRKTQPGKRSKRYGSGMSHMQEESDLFTRPERQHLHVVDVDHDEHSEQDQL